MFNLSRAGSLAFFILFIHSILFFFASAAPVSVTPTSISVPSYKSYAVANKFPQLLSRHSSKRDSQSYVLRSLAEPEIETLVRRKSVGAKIKGAFQKAGSAIKNVAKKVGNGVKTAAKKVGNFVKTTGAKVAKVGLKVLSTAQSIGAKVAGFIPGVGKPIGKALKGASAVTNAISNKIPAKLGSKLDKGMKVMDTIRNPMSAVKGKAGKAAGKALDAILRREEDERVVHRELDDMLWDREFNDDDLYTRDYEPSAILGREEDEWVVHRELDDMFWNRESDDDDLYARNYEIEERDEFEDSMQ
jgi:hypothetical protein